MGRYTEGGVGRDMIAGALAGAAAIWVTSKLDWSMYRAGGPERIRQTEAARPGGMDPAHALAAKAADAVGVDIGNPKDNPTGHAVQYGLAMGMGALYGLLRGMSPAVSTGRGALFGLAMFVLKDEVANTVLGTGGNPLDYPVQDHARGAAAHTVFGVVTDLGTRLLAPWRDEVVIERGPPLSERIEHGRQYLDTQGRRYLEQGRQYLDQGLEYADKYGRRYLEQGREYVDQGRDYADKHSRRYLKQGREYVDQGREYAEQGRRQAGEYADRAQREAARAAARGRRYASQAADEARRRVPDVDSSDVRRAKGWLSSLFG